MVGMAIADGKIENVNQPVIRYLPEFKGSGYEAASIQDLLEMSSAAKFSNILDDPESDPNVMWSIADAGGWEGERFLEVDH
jgi:CubicO group peptidase (beta-lactamase class C family)